MSQILAWHFVGDRLRDGSRIPKDGVTLHYPGPIIPCQSGLHASKHPFDALRYAPGPTLCLVRCGGTIVERSDKLACSERTILARMDATEMLRYYARMQALSVVHLWDASDAALDWLMTCEPSARSAARSAAWAAAAEVEA